MRLKKTERGFYRGEFKDVNGDECSIQESSSANGPRIWLGMNQGTHGANGAYCMARMHLSIGLAKSLVIHLSKFIETGGLK